MKKLMYFTLLIVLSCASTPQSSGNKQFNAFYEMGLSYMQEAKYQDAFVQFQKALKDDPNNQFVLNALGLIYLKFEDLNKAEQSFIAALNIDGDYSRAHNNLGVVFSREKKWDKAAVQFENALKNLTYSSPGEAYYNLGNAYYRLKKYKTAIKNYKNALRRSPGFYIVYYGLALCYNMIEEYGDAAFFLAEGIKADPEIKGSRGKAADVFSARLARTVDDDSRKDYHDLMEILNY
ncbi:lipoprotein NlpI [bacterium BMS3Abin07]|nr:lipoprotein NlpI [bacterium BMS3Abin07]GBE32572.1 lipoprotein NlpI [bacterium BMS3Bbin05]HDO22906.1 tetratricopeptide repeat protein [Nitrospirota bacterium]